MNFQLNLNRISSSIFQLKFPSALIKFQIRKTVEQGNDW